MAVTVAVPFSASVGGGPNWIVWGRALMAGPSPPPQPVSNTTRADKSDPARNMEKRMCMKTFRSDYWCLDSPAQRIRSAP